MIYVAGDSHQHPFENNPLFTLKPIGAATAHNINKPKSTNDTYNKLMATVNIMDKEKDTIIIICGEIDCRFHIYYQFKKRGESMSIAQIIGETIQNYAEVMTQLENMKIKFVICSTVPLGWTYEPYLTQYGATYYMGQFLGAYKEMPTPETYYEIYRLFNDKLKNYCRSKGYLYLDVYAKFLGSDGHMQKEYAWDLNHLDLKAQPIIIEMLKEIEVIK